MGKFEIYKDKRGEFRFRLKARNGQIILTGEGYKAKSGCENGIASIRKNATVDSRYDCLKSKNGKPYFNLRAGNNQIIGNSEIYSSISGMKNGISSVKKNASKASVVDLS
jgi:uncharacterized protein YegP (UPF0339 family)